MPNLAPFQIRPSYPRVLQLNRGHCLSRGLIGCWMGNSIVGGRMMDLCGHNDGVRIGGANWGLDAGMKCTVSGTDYIDCGSDASLRPAALPISCIVTASIDTSQSNSLFLNDDASNYCGFTIYTDTSGHINVQFGNNTGNGSGNRRTGTSSNLPIVTKTPTHITGIARAATDFSAYNNGQACTMTTSGSGGALAYSGGPTRFGKRSVTISGLGLIGTIYGIWFYNRALGAPEVWAHYQRPWQMFMDASGAPINGDAVSVATNSNFLAFMGA